MEKNVEILTQGGQAQVGHALGKVPSGDPWEDLERHFSESRLQGPQWRLLDFPPHWQPALEVTRRTQYVPVNLEERLDMVQRTVSQLANAVADLREALRDRPVMSNTSIIDLNSEQYSLRYSIPIVMEEWDDEVVATLVETETFGSGATPSEALSELKRRIVALYEDLASSDPGEFGMLPAAWWRILRHYVVADER